MNGIAEEVRREVLAAYVGTEADVLLETPLSGTLYAKMKVDHPGHSAVCSSCLLYTSGKRPSLKENFRKII